MQSWSCCRGIVATVLSLALPLLAHAGPDVIVGEIPDVSNYGASSGNAVWAIGTTSCNLGDAELTWIDCSTPLPSLCNQHPVISQNLYRLHDGRFEQLGQAWLKHGFCALQGTVCSSGCSPSSAGCDALGILCSDPYSSGLNGSQGGLGPKYLVNPATGFFPVPYITSGNNPDATLNKRLHAPTGDISPVNYPGALYFVSSIYIQPEDAAAGNANNNQSYRRVSFSGNTMALNDTTQRQKPAIQAWKDHGLGVGVPDPDVLLVNVDVPGDGRFIVGCKVKLTGDPTYPYEYEYAIQNLYSDRAARAVSVPLQAGALVSAIGFRDVPYHSGELQTGTDWTGAASGSAVTWTMPAWSGDHRTANALRWDTIYNYRFRCNHGPASGLLTMTLFDAGSGSPGTASAMVLVPDPSGVILPGNDECATAIPVVAGSTNFTNANATNSGPAEAGACGDLSADVWFRYQATCNGNVTIDTCGSAFNTTLAVYATNCPAAPNTAIACNDNASSGTCSGSQQSSVTFNGTNGTIYYIRVGGSGGAQGAGILTITDPGCGPFPPPNDACANAIPVYDGIPYLGTTTLATNDGTATCGTSSTSPDVWHTYTPCTSGTVIFELCGSSYDTVVSVRTACGTGGTQVGCIDDRPGGAPACPASSLHSYLSVNLTAGVTYYVRVAGYQGLTGDYRLLVIGGGGAPAPGNDDCDNRAGVGLGSTPFNTCAATTDGPAHGACPTNVTKDVWFNHPSSCDGQLTISINGLSFNGAMAVYDDAGCLNLGSRLLACVNNSAGTGSETVTIQAVSGRNYTIRVGGVSNAGGSGTLEISCVPDPVGACCFGNGTCEQMSDFNCVATSGNFLGVGIPCTPDPCNSPTGACCYEDGSCDLTTQAACQAGGGSFQGPGSSCSPNPCPQPSGACCLSGGTCQDLTLAACNAAGGNFQGAGVPCAPGLCSAATGACCLSSGSCGIVSQAVCGAVGGSFQGVGSSCTPNPCAQPNGACCLSNGTCQVTSASNCASLGGTFGGAGSVCLQRYSLSPNLNIPDNSPTGVTSTINVPDNFTVSDVNVALVIRHTYQGDVTVTLTAPNSATAALISRPGQPQSTFGFSANNFGNPGTLAPMVLDDAGANVYDVPTVAAPGTANVTGTWKPDLGPLSLLNGTNAQGNWVMTLTDTASGDTGALLAWELELFAVCEPDPVGACCFADGSCIVVDGAVCNSAGGGYQGTGSTCSPSPCAQPTGRCCFLDGSCTVVTAAACGGAGGDYQGNGTGCTPNPCPQPLGACCGENGVCDELTEAECLASGGVYQGAFSVCTPNPCPLPIGACCLPDGLCVIATSAECAAFGGAFQGGNSLCPTVAAVRTYSRSPALVIPDFTTVTDDIVISDLYGVADLDVEYILRHTFVGDLNIRITHGATTVHLWSRDCGGNDNMNVVADDEAGAAVCATPVSGSYNPASVTPGQSLSAFDDHRSDGVWTLAIEDAAGADTGTLDYWALRITPRACVITGACCLPEAPGCIDGVTQAQCQNAFGGVYQGDFSDCVPNPCPQPTGACCLEGGTCVIRTLAECQAIEGEYQGDGSGCTPNPCVQPVGACCFADGSCLIRNAADCGSQGGSYQGDGSGCTPNPCPQPPTGACCRGSNCVIDTQAGCDFVGGDYRGDGSSCTPNPCVQNRCAGVLVGDANCDNSVNNFDIDFFVEGVLIGSPPEPTSAPAGYLLLGGTQACWDKRRCWGDVNCDGVFNNFDIDPFVACILVPPTPGTGCPGCGIQACCLPGSCAELFPAACTMIGGVPMGPGSNCGNVVCP
ncbi:MAG: proprotein convertase P-domain-containing protein [Planctomycetia bacterium]|nr:MAG: proprotein convertase P-domain-containing protein [Planctomycetia bacterium]